jgi:hypothetical protein
MHTLTCIKYYCIKYYDFLVPFISETIDPKLEGDAELLDFCVYIKQRERERKFLVPLHIHLPRMLAELPA